MSTPATPQPVKPLHPPPRYVNKARCVSAWHGYLVAFCGEYPMLKTLSANCGVPKVTVYRHCTALGLRLSETRPRRRGLPLFSKVEKEDDDRQAGGG